MKSIMKHRFSDVPEVKIPRSTFDRSHGVKSVFDAGYLVPIYIDEALPGDTFKCNLTGFACNSSKLPTASINFESFLTLLLKYQVSPRSPFLLTIDINCICYNHNNCYCI